MPAYLLEVSLGCHQVGDQHDVACIYFKALLLKRVRDLFDQRSPCGFDAKRLPYLIDVVCSDPCEVDAVDCHYLCKVGSCGLDYPLFVLLYNGHAFNIRHALYSGVEQLALERQQRLRVRVV